MFSLKGVKLIFKAFFKTKKKWTHLHSFKYIALVLLCASGPNQLVTKEKGVEKDYSQDYQYLNHFFFFSKDPSRWERYPYDPRYRDPRSYDQRYWYDAEHNPYQKREAYPYGSRFVQSIHILPVLFPELGQQILWNRLLKYSVTRISQCC